MRQRAMLWDDQETDYDNDHDLFNEGIEEEGSSDESTPKIAPKAQVRKDPQSPVRAPQIMPDKLLCSNENVSQTRMGIAYHAANATNN